MQRGLIWLDVKLWKLLYCRMAFEFTTQPLIFGGVLCFYLLCVGLISHAVCKSTNQYSSLRWSHSIHTTRCSVKVKIVVPPKYHRAVAHPKTCLNPIGCDKNVSKCEHFRSRWRYICCGASLFYCLMQFNVRSCDQHFWLETFLIFNVTRFTYCILFNIRI